MHHGAETILGRRRLNTNRPIHLIRCTFRMGHENGNNEGRINAPPQPPFFSLLNRYEV